MHGYQTARAFLRQVSCPKLFQMKDIVARVDLPREIRSQSIRQRIREGSAEGAPLSTKPVPFWRDWMERKVDTKGLNRLLSQPGPLLIGGRRETTNLVIPAA